MAKTIETFGPRTTAKLLRMANVIESRGVGISGPRFHDATLPTIQKFKIGKTATDLPFNDTATINIWRNGVDTGETVTATHDWLDGSTISADLMVLLGWFDDEEIWRVIDAECEGSSAVVIQAANSDVDQTVTETFADIDGLTTGLAQGDISGGVDP